MIVRPPRWRAVVYSESELPREGSRKSGPAATARDAKSSCCGAWQGRPVAGCYYHDELRPIVSLTVRGSSEITSEDRGDAVGPMRSSRSCGILMRSSTALASSPPSIVTAVQRRPPSVRHPRGRVRAIGFLGCGSSTSTSRPTSKVRAARRHFVERLMKQDRLERALSFLRRLAASARLASATLCSRSRAQHQLSPWRRLGSLELGLHVRAFAAALSSCPRPSL